MTGFFSEPDARYHAQTGRYMSSHLLMAAHESLAAWRERLTAPKEDSPALAFGRAAHVALTEADAFDAHFVTGGPTNPCTGKTYHADSQKYRTWAAEQNRQCVTPEARELAERMAAAVRRHRAAGKLLAVGAAEQVARLEYVGVPCQIRVDWLADNWIADYKTTSDVFTFTYAIEQYGYLTQAAFYQAIAEIATGRRLPYFLIAAEKSDAAPVVVWQLNQDAIDQRRLANEQKLAEIRDEFLAFNAGRPDLSLIEQRVDEFSYCLAQLNDGDQDHEHRHAHSGPA